MVFNSLPNTERLQKLENKRRCVAQYFVLLIASFYLFVIVMKHHVKTFLTKRFCKKNEGFSKREFFIRYPKLTRPSDEFSSSVSL